MDKLGNSVDRSLMIPKGSSAAHRTNYIQLRWTIILNQDAYLARTDKHLSSDTQTRKLLVTE